MGVPDRRFPDLWQRGKSRPQVLSPQVRRVAQLLSQGFDDNAVARAESIDVRTVRRRVANLLEYLDARTRFQAGYRFRGLG